MSDLEQRPIRVEVAEHCTIVREDGTLVDGILVDLSDEGFCLETSAGLEFGERVEMRVSGLGCIAGLIRWLDANVQAECSNHASGELARLPSSGLLPES